MRTSLRTELSERPYSPTDKPALLSLERSAGDAAWSADQIEAFLGLDRTVLRVIAHTARTDVPLCFYGIQHREEHLYIANLIVEPQWRRQGVASFALERIVQIARKLDCERIVLDVQERNLGAQLLYRANGFRAVQIAPRHYPDQDGYRMEKGLDPDEEPIQQHAVDAARERHRSRLDRR